MEIVGRGMIALALLSHQDEARDTVVLAGGVANSATKDSSKFEREYDLLCRKIDECLADDKRLVYFSSGGALHSRIATPRNEITPLVPANAYGRHKVFCEAVIARSGVRHLILRLPNLIGRNQNPYQLIPALVKQTYQGVVTLYEGATRDLVDVEDFSTILVKLLKISDYSDTIVVASGFSIPVVEIHALIQDVLGTRAEIRLEPGGEQQVFDITKLKGMLGSELPFCTHYYRDVIIKNLG